MAASPALERTAAVHRDRPGRSVADDARTPLRDGAAHPADHGALGPPGDAAHGDVEATGDEARAKLRPAKADPANRQAEVVCERGRDVDVETPGAEREGRIVAAGTDAENRRLARG